MPGSSAMFRTIEPHARTMASVFRLEWLPAVAKLSRNGLYAWEDVPYRKDSSDVKHTLDVFIPGKGPGAEFPRPKTPVVLFWHGGSWRRGDKQWKGTVYSNIGIACARAGYVGAVCNYRLRPQAPSWEEQVDDLAAAVAWAWRSADRFGGDGQRLFLVGHSAGAHLVSSLLSDCSALERQGMSAEEARRVLRGVVLMAGVYDVPRLARLPVGGLQIAKAIFGERGDGVGWARASPSKVLRAVGKRADLFRREGGGGAALSPREAAAEDAASSAGGRRGGNTAPEGRASAPSAPGAAGSSDVLAAAAVRCPLLDVPVMVLNAKDDFHLDGDAVSLIRSMRLARRQLRGDPALAGAERLADLRAAAQTAGEKATAAGAMSAAAQAAIDDDAADDADTEDEHDYAEAWWSMTGDAPQLLWGRVARARRGRKVAEFKDEAALPPPLIEWEWLVPGQDGEDAWEGGPSPPKKAQASAAGGQEGPGKRARTSQRGLRLHAQPGTNAVWGRVEHRNHITLVALVGQEGDPTTAAMVEFFNEGHRRVATEPQGTWQEDKQERA
ncbi:hypothetical protein FNF27_07774 [Cafeteria roenbergensis]|uniref:BD-FAE-like domain-containing protein n=1 Tax=Cafeteria roenbergensis TaxID=33653 RepID=A0A5A8DGJ1_CAFRO|nr:hypothetical protein FNF27_07774 [Cafeteria roenbergensis]